MRVTTITCDGCGEVIAGKPGFPRNDYLVLSVDQAPAEHSGIVYGIVQHPMLKRACHFHNEDCLRYWAEERASERKASSADYKRRKVPQGPNAYSVNPADELTPKTPMLDSA